jgi:uncharacterized membrane protein YhaH (DUF805 family)
VKILRRLSAGRLNRRNYALGILMYLLINFFVIKGVGIETFTSTAFARAQNEVERLLLFLLIFLYIAMMVLIHSILVLRRLHDVGIDIWTGENVHKIWERKSSSPWLYILEWTFYPLSIFPLFYLIGENKENKYGKPPEPKIDLKSLVGFSGALPDSYG